MTSLAVVVYSTDNLPYTELAVDHLFETIDNDTDVVVVDNGSNHPFPTIGDLNIRYRTNIGGNAVFHRWMRDDWFAGDEPDLIAFLHCDLMVHEEGWDQRVKDQFEMDPLLALVGFVGSNEIDELGGRGAGTMLNYAGEHFEGIGQASPAEAHGRRMTGFEPAAVLDHCSMIFRREMLKQLTPQENNYAPEHFYDRILSCEVLEKGWHLGVLGISVDHFSGGIGPGNAEADALRKRWLQDERIPFDPERSDLATYVESERRFKARFGGFYPLRVMPDYSVMHVGG